MTLNQRTAKIDLVKDAWAVGEHFTEPATGDAWSTWAYFGTGFTEHCRDCGRALVFGLIRFRNRKEIGRYCMSHAHITRGHSENHAG
jgi:hypothetical protein